MKIKIDLDEVVKKFKEPGTNQEQRDMIKKFLDGIRFEVEERGAPFLKDSEILAYIEQKAEETGFSKTREFSRLKVNMEELGFILGSLIKGLKGEEACKKALGLMSLDEKVRILYNVTPLIFWLIKIAMNKGKITKKGTARTKYIKVLNITL